MRRLYRAAVPLGVAALLGSATPVTVDAVVKLVLEGRLEPAIRPFGLDRFAPPRAAE